MLFFALSSRYTFTATKWFIGGCWTYCLENKDFGLVVKYITFHLFHAPTNSNFLLLPATASPNNVVSLQAILNVIKCLSFLVCSFVMVTKSGPAVNLKITATNGRMYSVDLTLAIKCLFHCSYPFEISEWVTRPRNGIVVITIFFTHMV